VLVSADSGKVVTVKDVSEARLRKYFHKRGVDDDILDDCFALARNRYDRATASVPPNDDVGIGDEDDELLFDLDRIEDDDVP